jgi:hypothetical protein
LADRHIEDRSQDQADPSLQKTKDRSPYLHAFVAFHLERTGTAPEEKQNQYESEELTHNMYRLECILPGETLLSKILLGMDDEQKQLFKIGSIISQGHLFDNRSITS